MRNRVDKLGVTEPEIRKQGSDQIVIQLPGVQGSAGGRGDHRQDRPARALRPRDVAHRAIGLDSRRARRVRIALRPPGARAVAGSAGYGRAPTTSSTRTRSASSTGRSTRRPPPRSWPNKRPNARQVLAVPDKMVVVTCGENAVVCPGGPQGSGVAPDRTYYYLFKYEPPDIPQMTGEDLKLDGTRADFDTSASGGGRPIVTMEFTGKGADRFEEITRDEWTRGRIRQAPQHFAIVLDREIRTFPQIDYRTARSRAASAAAGRRSRDSTRSARPRTSRSSSRPARCRSTSRRSPRTTSRRRSARTRSRRQSAPRSAD